jgi:hypothetical protein
MSRCYYCGDAATSTEHVPPKCLFPESIDAYGEDLRRNLITVPSCDVHNLAKSKDDEFLMVCLTTAVGNNGIGFIQTNTKVRRAVQRTSGRLLGTVMSDPEETELRVPDGPVFPVMIGRPDLPRLCRALEHVARGLYLHAFGERFEGKCSVMPEFIEYGAGSGVNLLKNLARVMVGQERSAWRTYGENERVFHAEIGPSDQYGMIPVVMTFFRGSRVFVGFQPVGVEQPFRTLAEATPDNPLKVEIRLAEDEV